LVVPLLSAAPAASDAGALVFGASDVAVLGPSFGDFFFVDVVEDLAS
jgi:hypothetical protein